MMQDSKFFREINENWDPEVRINEYLEFDTQVQVICTIPVLFAAGQAQRLFGNFRIPERPYSRNRSEISEAIRWIRDGTDRMQNWQYKN